MEKLQKQFSEMTGKEIEITIRGYRSFTFSFEEESKKAESIIINFFKSACKSIKAEYDKKCDYTCIYLEV